jgi:hypothetical protein
MYAVVSVVFSSFWMVVVAANLNKLVLTLGFLAYFTSEFISNVIAGLLNNRSQFAKVFLIFS